MKIKAAFHCQDQQSWASHSEPRMVLFRVWHWEQAFDFGVEPSLTREDSGIFWRVSSHVLSASNLHLWKLKLTFWGFQFLCLVEVHPASNTSVFDLLGVQFCVLTSSVSCSWRSDLSFDLVLLGFSPGSYQFAFTLLKVKLCVLTGSISCFFRFLEVQSHSGEIKFALLELWSGSKGLTSSRFSLVLLVGVGILCSWQFDS